MSRRLMPARVPGARPHWARSNHDYPLIIDRGPLPTTEVMAWAQRQIAPALDVIAGRGWVLSAIGLDNGESVVSLVVSHCVTDAQGMAAAVDLAVRSDLSQAIPDLPRPTLRADLADAANTSVRLRTPAVSAAMRYVKTVPRGGANARVAGTPSTAVRLGNDQLDDIAATQGGTVTGLILAITANVVRSVRGRQVEELRIVMPVSLREQGDTSSGNKVAFTEVVFPPSGGARYTDLREVRRRSKAAYAVATPRTSPPSDCDAAVSAVGLVSQDIVDAVGSACAFAGRSVMVPSDGEVARSNSATVFIYVVGSPDATSLTFVPGRIQTSPLDEPVHAELAQWGITPQFTW
ncbi:hypothetical protein ACIBCN_26530 [Nocardia sp. NPDC051052]|uniref:hypothetical protein n=1 Tax=Nocardia sp. NPDC051052 TaxID=3364322 RepID=UPI0037B0DD9A